MVNSATLGPRRPGVLPPSWHRRGGAAATGSPRSGWTAVTPLHFALRVAGVLLILLLTYLLRAPYLAGQPAGGAELVVGPGERFARIGDALDQARDGDRIRIRPGVYREGPISISKSVALVGEGFPVLDGEKQHPVLIVRADQVEIRGLLIRDTGVSYTRDYAAIRVEEASGCVIEGNRLVDNFFGIYLAKTRGCRVADNQLQASGTGEASSGNGIHLWNARDTQILDNRITGHRDGIYLEFAEGATLRGNHSENNLRYGLHFMFSHDTDYGGNVFRHNRAGVAIMYSKRVRMTGNRFEDNWGAAAYGLLLKEITDSEIRGNVFRRNTVAIYAEGSSRSDVTANHFTGNGWAVRLRSNTRELRFVDNNFVDNAFEVATDSRHSANSFAGNFWSSYRGYDLSGDGFGDVPHRPVRLFSLVVERTPAAMVLLRTAFVDLLDLAERVLPALTPETLVDSRPRMREVRL